MGERVEETTVSRSSWSSRNNESFRNEERIGNLRRMGGTRVEIGVWQHVNELETKEKYLKAKAKPPAGFRNSRGLVAPRAVITCQTLTLWYAFQVGRYVTFSFVKPILPISNSKGKSTLFLSFFFILSVAQRNGGKRLSNDVSEFPKIKRSDKIVYVAVSRWYYLTGTPSRVSTPFSTIPSFSNINYVSSSSSSFSSNTYGFSKMSNIVSNSDDSRLHD